ncbi:unnamed protein product, partial [Sphagnum balticum]
EAASGEPWTFWLEKCPLCDKPNQKKFTHKPDTAGVRAIIVEGGGVREITVEMTADIGDDDNDEDEAKMDYFFAS